MKNILVYLPTGLNYPEVEILLSKTQIELDKKNKVFIVLCKGGKNYACSKNIYSSNFICATCNFKKERYLQKLKGNYKIILLPSKINNTINKKFSRNQIQNFFYKKKIDTGLAAYGSYIGLSRDKNLTGFFSRSSINRLLNTSNQLFDFFYQKIILLKIDKVIMYNARLNQYRPLLRAAQKHKISLDNMEFKGHRNRIFNFGNNLATDMNNFTNMVNKRWKEGKNDKKKNKIIKDYYEHIRNGAHVIQKSFNKHQNLLSLPLNWDHKKKNVVIFSTSDDEFETLGGEYAKIFYKDQFDGIKKISSSLSKMNNIKIWVKMHPRLKGVKWDFVKNTLDLSKKFENVEVIGPESKISSYPMLDKCFVSLAFCSHLTIEANYQGLPSILFGHSNFDKLKVCYAPKNHNQLIKLIKKKNLPPINNIGSKKFAYFWMTGGQKLKYFSGSLNRGFYFKKNSIKLTIFYKYIYAIGKISEKFRNLCNFYLRSNSF